jgi:hypothetical protein
VILTYFNHIHIFHPWPPPAPAMPVPQPTAKPFAPSWRAPCTGLRKMSSAMAIRGWKSMVQHVATIIWNLLGCLGFKCGFNLGLEIAWKYAWTVEMPWPFATSLLRFHCTSMTICESRKLWKILWKAWLHFPGQLRQVTNAPSKPVAKDFPAWPWGD